jgi:hypothetical protein
MIDQKLYEELVNTSVRGKYHAITHKKMEDKLPSESYENILEVGGGSGEHINFVKCHFVQYECTDLVLPIIPPPTQR